MFFNSQSFKILESGLQASWMEQQLHLQNMANIETPGYKAKSLVFEKSLAEAKGSGKTKYDSVKAYVVDDPSSSSRPDGNNVNLDKEGIESYKAYARYSVLLEKIKGQFTNYSYVLNSNMK